MIERVTSALDEIKRKPEPENRSFSLIVCMRSKSVQRFERVISVTNFSSRSDISERSSSFLKPKGSRLAPGNRLLATARAWYLQNKTKKAKKKIFQNHKTVVLFFSLTCTPGQFDLNYQSNGTRISDAGF